MLLCASCGDPAPLNDDDKPLYVVKDQARCKVCWRELTTDCIPCVTHTKTGASPDKAAGTDKRYHGTFQ